MNLWLASAIFVGSLALSALSSIVLSEELDRLGSRYRFPEGLQGIVTALGADAPEIAAAIAAIMGGSADMGIGIVLGSNIFNLAALLGLSAVIAGRVRVGSQGLLFNGGVALAVTAIALALIVGSLAAWLAVVLVAVVLLPYVVLSSMRSEQVENALPNGWISRFLSRAVCDCEEDNRKDHRAPAAIWLDMLTIVPALSAIVLASFGMVDSANRLGGAVGIPHVILGILVLATLTGVPNVLAAIHLARRGRGAAVLSESLNSNSINVVAGICLPALVVGISGVSTRAIIAAWWLLAATALTVVLTYIGGGLRRWEGAVVIAIYLAFIGVIIAG